MRARTPLGARIFICYYQVGPFFQKPTISFTAVLLTNCFVTQEVLGRKLFKDDGKQAHIEKPAKYWLQATKHVLKLERESFLHTKAIRLFLNIWIWIFISKFSVMKYGFMIFIDRAFKALYQHKN